MYGSIFISINFCEVSLNLTKFIVLKETVHLLKQIFIVIKYFLLANGSYQIKIITFIRCFCESFKLRYQAAVTVEISILLICFCSFDLFCPLLEKDSFIEIAFLLNLVCFDSL